MVRFVMFEKSVEKYNQMLAHTWYWQALKIKGLRLRSQAINRNDSSTILVFSSANSKPDVIHTRSSVLWMYLWFPNKLNCRKKKDTRKATCRPLNSMTEPLL